MQMNAGIILSGQQPDFVNTLARSTQAAQLANQNRDQNALRQLYQTQGQGIAAGDPNALNALAQIDPMAALGVKGAQQDMGILSAQESRAVESWAMQKSAAERAAAAAQVEQGLMMGIQAYRTGDLNAVNSILQQAGEAPIASLDEFPGLAARYKGALDVLVKLKDFDAPPAPLSGPGKVQADINAGVLPAGTQLRSPQVVVNTGDQASQRPIVDKPSKGFQRVWDEERQTYVDRPIPGGEVETDRSAGAQKADLAASNYRRKADIVDGNIEKAIGMLDENGRWVAGYGSLLSALPETEARSFQATIDTIKANLGFDELQAMRDASPTGGALGGVSEREIGFLQSIEGNLDAAQRPEQLRAVLVEIRDRRAEFAQERAAIMAKNQTAAQAADLQQRVRGIPDFGGMSDQELDAWIEENGQ